jgi:peptide/nickel transport system substrate-binding protein
MRSFVSWEMAQKANKWQGLNVTRWHSEAYDEAYRASEKELDPVKRALLFIAMNDMVIDDNAVIPVVYRPAVNGFAKSLRARLSGWDNVFADLPSWYREA